MKGKKILIIDDDLAFCEILHEILMEEGAEVLIQHDGESGLTTAFAEHPDFIVCDVMMPGISGTSVLEQIRKDDWGQNVPMLMLTNVNEPDVTATSVEEESSTEFLLKIDWTLDQIAEKIRTILEKTQ